MKRRDQPLQFRKEDAAQSQRTRLALAKLSYAVGRYEESIKNVESRFDALEEAYAGRLKDDR